tara:strand:- start:102 stop:506 length:405 start_codon:yes stop_codon:yes gene_type:complete
MINDEINNNTKGYNMIRYTIPQAISYLVDKVLDMVLLEAVSEKDSKLLIKAYKLLASNPMELKTKLETMSRGKITLKGSREATNISFAPKETIAKYSEAQTLVGSISTFKGKDGIYYTCGIYCKKVIVKKDTKK